MCDIDKHNVNTVEQQLKFVLQMGQPELAKRVKPEIISIPGFDDLKLIRPKAFPDSRGFFIESYNISDWESKLGFCEIFKQVKFCTF